MKDLFGEEVDIKLNSKWSIANFLSKPTSGYRNNSMITGSSEGLSENIKLELDKAISAINSSYAKSSMDFDKIFRDLTTRRKELKALMVELQATAKPVDLAALWGVESNLIVNQIRALENKQKIESEKFKQIREEKKLAKDRAGDTGTENKNGVTIVNNNSPLATANNLDTNREMGVNIASINPNMVVKSSNKFDNVEEAQPKAIDVIPLTPIPTPDNGETTAEQTVVATPSVNYDNPEKDIVVSQDVLGINKTTLGEVQNDMISRVTERLKHRDESLGTETITGYSYQHSLDTLVNKSQPYVERLFVCPSVGRYYVKAYGQDENGNFNVELPSFPYKSIVHMGSLQFNPLHKKVTFYYYPDPKDYYLVDNMEGAPDFYKSEWEKPTNEKFVLDEDTCNTLMETNE